MLSEDFKLVDHMRATMQKIIADNGINPIHGVYLMALAVRESTEDLCNNIGLNTTEANAFIGNAMLHEDTLRQKFQKQPSDTSRPSCGCGC